MRVLFLPQLSCMQIASFVCHIILSSVRCPALPYQNTLSYKQHDLRDKALLNVQRFPWFSLQILSSHISHSKKTWTRYYHKSTLAHMYSTVIQVRL